MNVSRSIRLCMLVGLSIMMVATAQAELVTYTLENVILDDGNAQMSGTFTWTYNVDDFENGIGQFSVLDIPFTVHDHTDLDATFDVGNSIEITLDGSVHDDGVDITLFLLQPLTPSSGSSVDLSRSRYEIGGNGFHDGYFLSGEIVLAGATNVGDETTAGATGIKLSIFPNPFNPQTTLSYSIARPGLVWLSIYDASGQLVSSVLDGVFSAAGEITYTWDGRDSRGQELGSGIYFARLKTEDDLRTRKMVLLR